MLLHSLSFVESNNMNFIKFSLAFLVFYGFTTYSFAQELKNSNIDGYSFRQLSNRTQQDRLPRVSTNGYVTWEGWDGMGDWEIFLHDGNTLKQITDNSVQDLRPVVNANGDIAWQQGLGFDSEILVQSDGVTTQITNDSGSSLHEERYPDINDNGSVVWARRTSTTRWTLATHDIESGTSNFTSTRGYRPHISNNEVIEASGALRIEQPSGDLIGDIFGIPSAQEAGYRDFRRGEIGHSDNVVIEADAGTVSGGLHPDQQGPRDILYWDGTDLQNIFSSDVWAGRADLNGSGILAFEAFGGLPGSQSGLDDKEIFVYDANTGNLTQLTDDDYIDEWATVLEDGSIVWQGTGNFDDSTNNFFTDFDIFIAAPQAVPEPSFLLPIGIALFATQFRRRRHNANE